jgi:gliding motility-associated-like protein
MKVEKKSFLLIRLFLLLPLFSFSQMCTLGTTGSQVNVTCNGLSDGTATANVSGGTLPYSYIWSNGATTSGITNLSAATYTVTVTDASCAPSGTELVTNGDFSSGDVGFTSDYTHCYVVGDGCLSAAGTCQVGNFAGSDHTSGTGNYLVVNGNSTPNATLWCQTINVTPGTTYLFSTWVTSWTNVSPAILQFSINGTPVGNVFNAPASTGVWNQFFESWNSGPATTATICITNQNTDTNGNDPGLDDISFQACGPCTTTTVFTITEPPPMVVNAGANDSVCFGDSVSLSVTPNGVGYTYGWLPASGLNNAAAFNPVASPAATITYVAKVEDQNGCSAVDSVTITVDPKMSIAHTVTNVSCYGECLGQAAVGINGGTSPYQYSWSSGCTAAICSNLCAGTYTVSVTDAFGCIITSDTVITEPDTLIAAITTFSPAICNDSCNGTATAIAIGGTGSGYTYSWSTTPAQNTAAASDLCAGTYTCTITDANNCTSSTSAAITEPAPITLLLTTTPTGCGPDKGTASVNVTGSAASPFTYMWSPGGQTTSVATGLSSGNYTVTVLDTNDCQAIQTVTIAVADNPVAAVSASAYTITAGENTLLSAAGANSFLWAPDTALTCDTCQVTTASPEITTMYCVTVSDTNECSDTACVTIRVTTPCPGDYIVPTAFSPNNDGFNDKFCLQGWNNCVSEFNILIFDRWGEKVFESNNPGFCWDGTYKAAFGAGAVMDMNAAVFVYVVEVVLVDGTEINRKGNITLLR